jgi:hypothetical protein
LNRRQKRWQWWTGDSENCSGCDAGNIGCELGKLSCEFTTTVDDNMKNCFGMGIPCDYLLIGGLAAVVLIMVLPKL